jgi:hypothetical protein
MTASYAQGAGPASAVTTNDQGQTTSIYSNNGNVYINAPPSGNTLSLTALGTSAATLWTSSGNTVSGSAKMSFDDSGNAIFYNTINNTTLYVGSNQSNSALTFTAGGAFRMVIAATGNVTINAPSSGVALTISANTTNEALRLIMGSSASYAQILYDNGTTNFMHLSPGPTSTINANNALALSTNGTGRLTIGLSGSVTINAPTSGNALSVTAAASANALFLQGAASVYTQNITASSTAGSSLGLIINAGTNSSDAALSVRNQAGSSLWFQINGVGVVTLAAPTASSGGFVITPIAYANRPTAPATGTIIIISDGLSPVYMAAAAGGGAVVTPIMYNGSAWVFI